MISKVGLGGYAPAVKFNGLPYTKKPKTLPDQTAPFFKILHRPIQSAIEFYSVVIAAVPGFGKSELADWLAEQLADYYGASNVNALRFQGKDIEPLLEAMDTKPVQILFLDDCIGEIKMDIQEQFDLIRHRYNDKLEEQGLKQGGLIFVFFTVQTIFSLAKEYRRNSTAMIIKSNTIDERYERELKNYIGKTGIDVLSDIERRVLEDYDHEAKGTSIIKLKTRSKPGLLHSGLAKEKIWTIVEALAEDAERPRRENRREILTEEDLDIQIEWERVRRLEDPDFLTQIVLMAPMALADQRTKKYQPKHAEAWKLKYADGWTTDHLSDEYDVAKATFSNNYDQGGWCAIFNREVAGYAAEYALQHRYYPDCEVYGKNIPEAPDLFNKDTGLMVEVKLRHRAEPPNLSMFSRSEIQNLIEGKPTQLALITYKPKHCQIEIYEPRLLSNPSNRTPENDPRGTLSPGKKGDKEKTGVQKTGGTGIGQDEEKQQ